eukprot:2802395-Amphidinium_carterae.1
MRIAQHESHGSERPAKVNPAIRKIQCPGKHARLQPYSWRKRERYCMHLAWSGPAKTHSNSWIKHETNSTIERKVRLASLFNKEQKGPFKGFQSVNKLTQMTKPLPSLKSPQAFPAQGSFTAVGHTCTCMQGEFEVVGTGTCRINLIPGA